MDYFTKNKMLFWCVIILVLINIITLGSFWAGRASSRPSAGSERRLDGGKIMEERLQLSDEQAKRFEQIRNEHFKRTRLLQDDTHKIRLHLLDEIFAPEPNEIKIQELLAEVGNKQSEFEKNLYNHFRELKNACNEEQVKELKIMLRDLIESTRPRDPRRHPNGPEGGMRPEFGPAPPPNR